MSVLRCLLLWLGVTAGALASGDLKTCDSADRQYHVAITSIHGDLICGGSLINESWILTDAYCYRWGMKVVLGGHPGPGRSVIINEPPVIKRIHGIPCMMMLKLPHPTKIEPVKLPACPHALNDEKVQIAGYRLVKTDIITTQTDSREAIKLQCVTIKLNNCRKVKGFRDFFHRRTETRVEISQRDVGGAMVYKNMIYGVLIHDNPQPALNDPAPYFDVCAFLDWINEVMTR